MADLQELIAHRGYVKGSITRLHNFSQNNLSELNKELLKEKCKKLSEEFNEYEALNKRILYLCPNDKEDYSVVEEKYFTTVSTINTAIATLSIHEDVKPHRGEFKKLPVVKIASFNGKNVVDFPPFINMFKSVIDSDSRLSLCEKLHYLRSFLTGEALDLIKNLMLTDENYNVALELLNNRFNNKLLIVNHHVNNILELPIVTKCTAQGLRSLVSVINLNIAALKNLKEPVEHWDTLLVNIVSKKVDSYTNRGFHQERLSKEIPKLSEFLDFLERRAIAMENTSDDKSSHSQRPVKVLRRESLPVTPSGPYLINTSLGYVVAGSLPITSGKISLSNLSLVINPYNNIKVCNTCITKDSQLEQTMSKFWEYENVPTVFKEDTSEHEQAEQVFQDSVTLENNRFRVALPLKVDLENTGLGHSFPMALSRLHNLERRFAKDINLFQQYKKFISDYIQQGHAKYLDIKNNGLDIDKLNFIPHHPVVNLSSKTTPVRAVFDGSAKTKNGLALNDILLNGPVVQSDLFDILTLLRTFKYVLLCDVKAMYRQVFLDKKYCELQNILWRESRESPVQCVQLQTVTYGLKSSAFLATRCLVELAHRFKDQFPLAAFCLQNSSYVDDIQFGSDDIYELTQTKNELCKLLSMGGFALHKWCSNDISLLKDIPVNLHQLDKKDFDKNCLYVKTLGLIYNVKTDSLEIQCPVKDLKLEYTKREMLSFISKFFDPLGLVGPILVSAKLLMQEVWFHDIRWDQLLPTHINKKWVEFAKDLINMPCIAVPRNVKSILCNSFELVGFSDASSVAYGCCLYVRVIGPDKCVNINLFCSKSRINPKNKTLTIPQLELESALLLAKLANKVNTKLSLKYNVRTYLYSDSKIVLAWLKTEPVKLNMYVANRVKKILELTSSYKWFYVNTADNPADCLSRGVSPSSLKDNLLWWHGPKCMGNTEFVHGIVTLPMSMEEILEIKETNPVLKSSNVCVKGNTLLMMLEKYSAIEKTTRIMAYVLRFINICKAIHSKGVKKFSPNELDSALQTIIRLDQSKHFKSEIQCLQTGNSVKSSLSSLNPFLDSSKLLRVGGRLHNADLPFAEKHPIILAKKSNITKGIIWRQHIQLKHAGQSLVLSSLSEKYWILNASREIKSVLYKCIICFKLKARNATQLMGSLPLDRVNMTRPFQIVGTDYGGPFRVKQTRIRNPVITKAYIVLFVCFVTKAIHIELASDMSTKTFMGCLKRFISRRNKPTKIYCDNGACYKGAANVLKELYDLQASTSHQDTVIEFCNMERISFHFIPSYSPVFGGLWEAGIKSVKYHMKRVIGNSVLTYEELYTVIVQIEGILNSRPLTPLSRDPDDMSYLTPGHFLTGSPLSSYPELNLSNVNVGRLSFWKQCEQMQQLFWKKWHKYYLVLLQNRPKWKSIQPNLKPGDMVILKYDNITPLDWPVGRILNVMPGKDGCVRALEVKTARGSVIRTSVMKVLYQTIETFFRCLINVQVMIEFRNMFFLKTPYVSLFLYSSMIKTMIIQITLSLQIEAFYDALKDGEETCERILVSECTGEKII